MDIWENIYNPFNSEKIIIWKEQIKGILDGKYLPPVSVTIDPTEKCNFNCIWCQFKKYRHYSLDAPYNKLLELVKFLGSWNVKSVCIAGSGEPFCYNKYKNDNKYKNEDNLGTIFKEIRNNGMEVSTITNGSLISNEDIEVLSKYGKWVGISIDASSEDTYRKVHRCDENIFQKVIDTGTKIANFGNKSCDVGFKFLLHPYNYKEIYSACELAYNMGCKSIHIRPPFLSNNEIFNKKIMDKSIDQIIDAAKEFNNDNFQVFGIIHKFDRDWKSKLPIWCPSPICTTFGSSGDIWVCCDTRFVHSLGKWYHDNNDDVGSNILSIWGSEHHVNKIKTLIPSKDCIFTKCTYSPYVDIIENVFVKDKMMYKFV